MKSRNICLTAIALLISAATVVAAKTKAIVTLYTDGQGNILTAQHVENTCTAQDFFCANEYKDGTLIKVWEQPE